MAKRGINSLIQRATQFISPERNSPSTLPFRRSRINAYLTSETRLKILIVLQFEYATYIVNFSQLSTPQFYAIPRRKNVSLSLFN